MPILSSLRDDTLDCDGSGAACPQFTAFFAMCANAGQEVWQLANDELFYDESPSLFIYNIMPLFISLLLVMY